MMKNKYVIDGDTLIVYNRKDNREMFFDADDFDKVNQYTWFIGDTGYARTNITQSTGKRTLKKVHRLLMNAPKDKQVDHINGDRLDNRKVNLRIVSNEINSHNRQFAKGYYWNKRDRKWSAYIKVNKKNIYLGRYNTEAEARSAYLKAKTIYHPTAPIHLYK